MTAGVRTGPTVVHSTEAQCDVGDYWIRKGYLHPDNPRPGQGYSRTWPPFEARVGRLMVKLVAAGMLPAAGAVAARKLAPIEAFVEEFGIARVVLELAPGVLLEIRPADTNTDVEVVAGSVAS